MSPIIARAAMRAAGRARPMIFNQASTLATRRAINTATKPQRGDYGRLVKHVVGNATVYFPVALSILGWPYLAYVLLDDRLS